MTLDQKPTECVERNGLRIDWRWTKSAKD